MAFFGGYTEDIDVTLENSAIYESEAGLGVIALECTQFEAELFEECVKSDIKEYQVVQEGGDVDAFQEGAWETVKTKVVNFVKKVWAKIKAFFNGWYAKIAARMMSDNKAFYNKFKKSVEDKDLHLLKLKFEKIKKQTFVVKTFDDLKTNKSLEEADSETVIESIYEKLPEKASSHSEAKKIMIESSFEDEDEVEYTDIQNEVKSELTESKAVKEAQKAFDDCNKKLSKTISSLEKDNKELKNISIIATATSRAQLTKLEAEVAIAKKYAGQCRRAFAKAVAYSPKTENAELLSVADAIATLG